MQKIQKTEIREERKVTQEFYSNTNQAVGSNLNQQDWGTNQLSNLSLNNTLEDFSSNQIQNQNNSFNPLNTTTANRKDVQNTSKKIIQTSKICSTSTNKSQSFQSDSFDDSQQSNAVEFFSPSPSPSVSSVTKDVNVNNTNKIKQQQQQVTNTNTSINTTNTKKGTLEEQLTTSPMKVCKVEEIWQISETKYTMLISVGNDYAPEDVKITMKERVMSVVVKKEKFSQIDGSSLGFQGFGKSFTVPQDANLNEIKSTFTTDGYLKIEVSRHTSSTTTTTTKTTKKTIASNVRNDDNDINRNAVSNPNSNPVSPSPSNSITSTRQDVLNSSQKITKTSNVSQVSNVSNTSTKINNSFSIDSIDDTLQDNTSECFSPSPSPSVSSIRDDVHNVNVNVNKNKQITHNINTTNTQKNTQQTLEEQLSSNPMKVCKVEEIWQISETKYTMVIPLGGDYSPEDVKITMKERVMTVTVKKEKFSQIDGSSLGFQGFGKNFTVPQDADLEGIKSTFTTDGNLRIEVSRRTTTTTTTTKTTKKTIQSNIRDDNNDNENNIVNTANNLVTRQDVQSLQSTNTQNTNSTRKVVNVNTSNVSNMSNITNMSTKTNKSYSVDSVDDTEIDTSDCFSPSPSESSSRSDIHNNNSIRNTNTNNRNTNTNTNTKNTTNTKTGTLEEQLNKGEMKPCKLEEIWKVEENRYTMLITMNGEYGPEDVNITVKNSIMSVVVKKEKFSQFDGSSLGFQGFGKSFSVPHDADFGRIKSVFTADGNLRIEVPRV